MDNMTKGIIGGYCLFALMLFVSRFLMPFLAEEVNSDSEFTQAPALSFLFFFILTLASCGFAGYSTHQLLTKYLNVESILIVVLNVFSWLLIMALLCKKMLSYGDKKNNELPKKKVEKIKEEIK